MKDNFSIQAKGYATFRPVYPEKFYKFLIAQTYHQDKAWDCGTGNGQVAISISRYFNTVFATDISTRQISNAKLKDNIVYSIQPAEQTDFADNSFSLVTIGQAIHWFNFDKFYQEVRRTAQKEAIIAAFGYDLFKTDPKVNLIIDEFYYSMLSEYWDPERKYIDEQYKNIPFPFQEISSPEFNIYVRWSFHELVGYLNTWSAVQHYIKKNNSNPIDLILSELKRAWGKEEVKDLNFPMIQKIGVVN